MALPPRLRKLALTAHVIASVGWLGAVIAFLNLSVTGLTSQDPQTVRGAYLVMERTGWAVLVPLSLASLLTGLISSLGSTWGLFRHYWVLFKLAINLVATIVLLLYTQTLAYLADVAAERPCPVVGVTGCGTHRQRCTPPPPSCSCWWPPRWPSTSPAA
jgi:uncharacterized membrane protein